MDFTFLGGSVMACVVAASSGAQNLFDNVDRAAAHVSQLSNATDTKSYEQLSPPATAVVPAANAPALT